MHRTFLRISAIACSSITFVAPAVAEEGTLPSNINTLLRSTQELADPRGSRLPLYVLPITNALSPFGDKQTFDILQQLDARGIGYTVDWQPDNHQSSLQEGLRIGRMQRKLGQPVAVNANACLYSFFDGSKETLHIDVDGKPFAETSFGGQLGCPFALKHRVPIIKERVEKFLRSYKNWGVEIDFIFADWEIDGPIEWNDAWKTCRKCERCRENIPKINNFREFQTALRGIRSDMQREAFGDNVTNYFPQALVGNYGVYPHGGTRYWYDYFEKEVGDEIPAVKDQKARYRPWAHEFAGTGYTFAMPVVYTWYPTFGWYDFDEPDYRWFYNMLLVASNAGKHTDESIPLIPFVHLTTTAPPERPYDEVPQFSEEKYRELLWHMVLRGHDTFFLWCLQPELPNEIVPLHRVYRGVLKYRGFLERGKPITFDVPKTPGPVVSGLRLGDHVLLRRTNFGDGESEPIQLTLADGKQVSVPADDGTHVVTATSTVPLRTGLLRSGEKVRFAIGCYEMPGDDAELKRMADSGINLIRCGNKEGLDRAAKHGMMGWVSLGVHEGATDNLRKQIESVADHPALAVWEGPDEIVWTFTAYSFLKDRAGFTRDDWNDQKQIAVDYSERVGNKVTANMHEGIKLVRELDKRNLPFWVNEAADSDVRFTRQYIDAIDITGCDYYAVRANGTDLQSVGRLVDRWDAIGHGRPVWMVLQGFSWHNLKPERGKQYPTFAESRFMAYDSIVHGSKGILYWGTNYIDDPKFRQSLYALTSELASIESMLIGNAVHGVKAEVIPDLFDPPTRKGVRAMLFQKGDDSLLILVNEDDHRHLGVDVTGLDAINGRQLKLLYGAEAAKVDRGGLVTRMQPFEVKLFATDKERFESKQRQGRSFGS